MAAMLASCSTDVLDGPLGSQSQKPAVAGKTGVGFDVYTARGITRSGTAGELQTTADTENGIIGLQTEGFGVFGYYTDNLCYTGAGKPNFMYNEKVSTEGWTYEPVKYWPNEYGDKAMSTDVDKVSFFAYAPYVEAADNAKGTVADDSYGITGFTKNSAAGDPIVKYKVSFDPTKQVDLCWGTVHSESQNWRTLNDGVQTLTPGEPFIDVEHPAMTDQKMKFNFLHALASLDIQIDADADVTAHVDAANGAESPTKVYVRSITLGGFAMEGALNLNNCEAKKPLWLNYNGQGELSASQKSFVINDGRKNGKEGTAAASEKNVFLNTNIISNNANTSAGVTGTLQNLFNADATSSPIFVIPTGEDNLTVTIVYDVETADAKLASKMSDGTAGSSVENKITKEISFNGNGLQAGYVYTVKLHLGLNSVKFDAAVATWPTAADEANVWLPSNTSEGLSSMLNPITFGTVNPATTPSGQTDPQNGRTGDQATAMTIMGLSADGTENIATASSQNASDWTSNNGNVVKIAENGTPSRAGFRAGTRADETNWVTALSSVSSIKIKPVGVGTATITAKDAEGNTSSFVVTVVAPSIELDKTSLTLYHFATSSDTDKGEVTAQIKIPAGVSLTDELKEATVVTNSYWNTETNKSVSLNADEGADEANNGRVCTVVMGEDGKITVTPAGRGTATVTVASNAGATKTFRVTVNDPAIKASANLLTIQKDGEKELTVTGTPAFDDENYKLVGTVVESSIASYADGVVKGLAEGTATLTLQYEGKTAEGDPKLEITLNVVDGDPTEMKVGEDIMAQNPLFKVAQYNVGAPQGEGESKTYSFVKYHSTTAQYCYTWSDAKNINISGYHLPTYAEQVAIIPSDKDNAAGTNIFTLADGEFKQYATNVEAAGTNYFYRHAADDYYAVRKIGENWSAWHYKFGANSAGVKGLIIESYILKKEITEENKEATAKIICAALPESEMWGKAKDESGDASLTTSSLVSRFLPACGRTDNISTSGVATAGFDTSGNYWSVTQVGTSTNAFRWGFYSGGILEGLNPQGFGYSVRLFRN